MIFLWVYIFPLGLFYFYLLLSLSLSIRLYGISKRRGVLRTKSQRGVVVGKSISNHHHHSLWQGKSEGVAYECIGIMEGNWVTKSIYIWDTP
jgi:hypothetical protein